MSIKFWDKGAIFPTALSGSNLRIYFTKDLYLDVPFMNLPKDFKINNLIPVSEISLLAENPDGDIIVGWFNGEVRIYNTNYGNLFRMVGLTKLDIYKIMEDNMDVFMVGSTRKNRIGEGKFYVPDIYVTRYYVLKNNRNYMIMDTSDGRPPIVIDVRKNPEIIDLVLVKGSGGDPLFIREHDAFVAASSDYQIRDPIIIPQPTNKPRLIRRGF